ncbi:hypothetical protein D3C80_1476850 [compost metagenome]
MALHQFYAKPKRLEYGYTRFEHVGREAIIEAVHPQQHLCTGTHTLIFQDTPGRSAATETLRGDLWELGFTRQPEISTRRTHQRVTHGVVEYG